MQRFFLFLIAVIGLVLPACNNSQTSAPHKIAIINPSKGLNSVVEGFMAGMKARGYDEGKNVTYFYYHDISMAEVDGAIAEIMTKDVDLVYSLTTPATLKAKKAFAETGIPLLFAPVFSPVDAGVVDSLAHSGGNLTGLKLRGSTAKALGWLQAVVPGVKRIFVPVHRADSASCMTLEDLQAAADQMGIELVVAEIATPQDLAKVLADIPAKVDGLWLTCSHMLFTHVHDIVAAATARRLPVAATAHIPGSGVLVSYGDANVRIGEQISHMADRILLGASARDMPIETADFLLTINLKTANRLGITIPDEILRQVDIFER
ncbi:MAG: ABC transporter substrate-binding protein [Desulfobulbaceae bacterium]|nr:ABC transporter substrate-binding protein [Desulfobulbaceae bacterium]HIJ78556.1 ABC transporter substrate-binding protein [Deltaproteobacteria bacterium]